METTRGAAADEDVLDGWSGSIHQPGFLVEFERFDLRPRQAIYLPAVPLEVLLMPGSVLSGHWDATADDADGQCTGELLLDVVPSTVDLAECLEPGPPTENNASGLDLVTMLAWGVAAHQMARRLPSGDRPNQ